VLTGTPLENKLDELYSIVQFLDFDTDIDEINLAAHSRVEEMRELVRQLVKAYDL